MGEVFAGFVCGFLLSALSAPLFAVTLFRLRATSAVLERMLPVGVSAVSVTMVLHFALFFFWTGMGIVFGLLLLAMEGAGDLPGFPNVAYTLFIFSACLALSAPFAAIILPWRAQIVAVAVVSFAVFGLLMPHMAGWAKFDSPAEQRDWRLDPYAVITEC